MNFFQSIAAMQVAGDWKIVIAKEPEGTLAVSVMLFNEKASDKASKRIPPLVLRETPQKLDEGFFAAIEQPICETASLLLNMQQYIEGREEARKHSQMEQDKAKQAAKEKTEKEKKYEELMKKVDELEGQEKFRDAWMKVPDPADYPEHADGLRERKSAIAKKFAPDLFS